MQAAATQIGAVATTAIARLLDRIGQHERADAVDAWAADRGWWRGHR